MFVRKGASAKMFRRNHRTAQPSLEVGTRQLTTSTSRVIIPTATADNGAKCAGSTKKETIINPEEIAKSLGHTCSLRYTEDQICTSHFEEISPPSLYSKTLMDPYVSAHCPLLDVAGTLPPVCCTGLADQHNLLCL